MTPSTQTKLTKIERHEARILGEAVVRALAVVEAEYGVKVTLQGGTYTGTGYLPKLQISVQTETGVAMTREARDFTQMASYYGLTAENLGAEVRVNGSTFRIVGAMTRRSKHPILLEDVKTAKRVLYGADYVKFLLTQEASRG
jgi:hypothetical protein